ncbi:MAG: helix-turn-helix transcriptional regulator [Bacteroidota bacterium]
MEVHQQLLFFFSALGAFNGLLLGLFFLFFAYPKHRSHYFLGLLLLALSVRVGKSVFYYFSDDLADIYIRIGLFACWFIGPLFFFYVRTALEIPKNVYKELRLHCLFLGLGVLLLFFYLPFSSLGNDWQQILVQTIYVQWIAYVALALFYAWHYRHKMPPTKKVVPSFAFWFWSICLGNALICAVFNMAHYTSYIVGALSFTFIFYLLLLLLLFTKKRAQLLLLHPPKYQNQRLEDTTTKKLKQTLQDLMYSEQAFLDPDLKLADVAHKLQVNPVQLSQFFNESLGIGFNDHINKYRVQHAQQQIENLPHFSLEAIGHESGFNSKSTFYKAFKKHTGTTPAKYREQF